MPKAPAPLPKAIPAEPSALGPRPALNRNALEGMSTKLLTALRTEISLELDRRKQRGDR